MRRGLLELEIALPDDVEIVADAVPTRPSFYILFREYNKFWLRGAAAIAGV